VAASASIKPAQVSTKPINGWDLVDSSAPHIVGGWHFDKDRTDVDNLLVSKRLWDRRIAMLSTFYYIRQNDLNDTFDYAEKLLQDPEDLMHKASGWMLREAGKRDKKRLLKFLDQHRYYRSFGLSLLSQDSFDCLSCIRCASVFATSLRRYTGLASSALTVLPR